MREVQQRLFELKTAIDDVIELLNYVDSSSERHKGSVNNMLSNLVSLAEGVKQCAKDEGLL